MVSRGYRGGSCTARMETDARNTADNPLWVAEPSAFAAKKKKTNDPDTPTYMEAMSGDDAESFWEAMQKEIEALVKRKTWSVVPRSVAGGSDIVPGTWAFKKEKTAGWDLS